MSAEVRTATPEDAGLVGRLLWNFNTEFDTPHPSRGDEHKASQAA